jgi:hypothetical protein
MHNRHGNWQVLHKDKPGLFPEGNKINDIGFGFNRAKLNWYVIDPLFLRQTNNLTPSGILANYGYVKSFYTGNWNKKFFRINNLRNGTSSKHSNI